MRHVVLSLYQNFSRLKEAGFSPTIIQYIIADCLEWATEEPHSDGPLLFLKKLRSFGELKHVRDNVNCATYVRDYRRYFSSRKLLPNGVEYNRIVGLMREIRRCILNDNLEACRREQLEDEFYRYLSIAGNTLTYDDFKELLPCPIDGKT